MLQGFEKLGGLLIEPRVVEIEETFHRVSPGQPALAWSEERIGMTDGMHNESGRSEGIFDTLQSRIELPEEIKVHLLVGAVQGKIQPG